MSQDASAQQTLIDDRTVADDRLAPADDRGRPGVFALIGAELFGTFLLVFVGLGIALYATLSGAGSLGVALGFGVALMAGMASVGHVSGGHFNPAVTLGYAVAGRMSWKDVPVYWGAQIVGAIAAAAAVFTTIPKSVASGDDAAYGSLKEFFSVTANGFGEHSPSFSAASSAFFKPYLDQGFPQEQIDAAIESGELVVPTFTQFDAASVGIIEVIATALFVGVILAVTDKRARIRFTSVVVGLTFGLLLLLAMPLSGGSLNPARSLAAAIFSEGWALGDVWIFWAAPLVGAIIAALFYRGFATTEPIVEYVYRDDTLDGEDDDLKGADDVDVVTETEVDGVVVVTEVDEVVVVTEVVPVEEIPADAAPSDATPSVTTAAVETATEATPVDETATDEPVASVPVKKAPVTRAPAKRAPAAKAPAKTPVARKAPVAAKAPVVAPATEATAPTDVTPTTEVTTDSVDEGPQDAAGTSK